MLCIDSFIEISSICCFWEPINLKHLFTRTKIKNMFFHIKMKILSFIFTIRSRPRFINSQSIFLFQRIQLNYFKTNYVKCTNKWFSNKRNNPSEYTFTNCFRYNFNSIINHENRYMSSLYHTIEDSLVTCSVIFTARWLYRIFNKLGIHLTSQSTYSFYQKLTWICDCTFVTKSFSTLKFGFKKMLVRKMLQAFPIDEKFFVQLYREVMLLDHYYFLVSIAYNPFVKQLILYLNHLVTYSWVANFNCFKFFTKDFSSKYVLI